MLRKTFHCNCFFFLSAAPSGKPQFKRGLNKIVGGTDVAPGELPYQVSFQDTSFGFNFHFCGASVYSADTIICAGHCVYGEDYESPADLRVRRNIRSYINTAFIIARKILYRFKHSTMHNIYIYEDNSHFYTSKSGVITINSMRSIIRLIIINKYFLFYMK